MDVSQRVGDIKYAIRDVLKLANELKAAGNEILHFNIGDPLKFDYKVPDPIQKGLQEFSGKGYYSDSVGDYSVREKISAFESEKQQINLSPDDTIFFQGVSEGIFFTFLSFLNPGDRVLVPGPTYPAYQSVGTAVQAEVVAYRCIEENGWIPDIDDIRTKLNDRTKLLVLINPNNPTGVVYSENVLKSIRDVVGESSATIISDEIYDQLVLDGSYTSYSSLTKDVPCVVFNGFSKVFLSPGYRAAYGYIIDSEEKISNPWEGVRKLCRVRLSPSTPISYAAAAGLGLDPPHLPKLKRKLRERRDLVVKWISEIDRVETIVPKAAFYIFPKLDLTNSKWKNDVEFINDLLIEKNVLFVYGSGFGQEYGNNHFRMVYLSPTEIIEQGMSRLQDFLR